MPKKLITPNQAKAELVRRGLSVPQWAKAHKLAAPVVYRVLSGRCLGLRGAGHKAAVLLGIKDGEIVK